TAPAEAAGQTLRLWSPDSSMGTGLVNGAGALCGACGNVGVAAPVEASRTRPAVAHAVAVRGEGLLEHGRHGLKWTCAHAHYQARAAHHRRRIDVPGTGFRCDTRARDAPVVAADASARSQDTPRGHRRARRTWMPCLGRSVTSPQGSTGGPG